MSKQWKTIIKPNFRLQIPLLLQSNNLHSIEQKTFSGDFVAFSYYSETSIFTLQVMEVPSLSTLLQITEPQEPSQTTLFRTVPLTCSCGAGEFGFHHVRGLFAIVSCSNGCVSLRDFRNYRMYPLPSDAQDAFILPRDIDTSTNEQLPYLQYLNRNLHTRVYSPPDYKLQQSVTHSFDLIKPTYALPGYCAIETCSARLSGEKILDTIEIWRCFPIDAFMRVHSWKSACTPAEFHSVHMFEDRVLVLEALPGGKSMRATVAMVRAPHTRYALTLPHFTPCIRRRHAIGVDFGMEKYSITVRGDFLYVPVQSESIGAFTYIGVRAYYLPTHILVREWMWPECSSVVWISSAQNCIVRRLEEEESNASFVIHKMKQ